MVARIALAAVLLGAVGCAPRLSTAEVETIERALTADVLFVSGATVLDSVHIRLEQEGLVRLAEIEPSEDPAVRAEAEATLRALAEGHLLEVHLSRCSAHDEIGARAGCVFIAGVGERLCLNATLLRLGLVGRDAMPVHEYQVAERASAPWRGLPAEVVRRLPAVAGDETVWATASGECYHRSSCRMAKGASPLPLRAALRRGLRPCSRCRPPEVTP